MPPRITAHLHELVFAMDGFADHLLTTRFGVDHNLFVFLNPLLDGALDVTRLAERLNLTKAAVSKRVPGLERDGWLVTTSDLAHGRRVVVSLTPRGRALVIDAGTLLSERFASMLDGLSIDVDRLDAELQSMIPAVRNLLEGELS
jgi:DNA-binding MarR family transcriptional regulator